MRGRTIAAMMLLGTGVAQADEPGFYAGIGVGQIKLSDNESGLSLSADDTAFKIFGGYQFNKNFAVEGAYIDGGNPSDNIQGIDVEIDASAFQAALRGMLPFNESISGFAKAGILFWDSTATASNGFNFATAESDGNDFSWGLGLDFNINQKALLRLEFEGADIAGTEFRLISLSVAYRF